MVNFLKKIARDTRGATAIEYGLIVALIFLAIVGSVSTFGGNAITMWNSVSGTIAAAISGA